MCWYVAWAPTPSNGQLGEVYIGPNSNIAVGKQFCSFLRRTGQVHRVILFITWVFEHLEMSTICLGMLLGLPHLQMAGWVKYI